MSSAPPPDLRRPTLSIAVLDDRPTIAEICAKTLRAQGYLADAFTAPHDLLASVEVTRYHAFVIDWLLEDATAEELIAHLRSRPESKTCPIFLLSANGSMDGKLIDDRMRASIERWRLHYRAKPYSPKLLAAEIAASVS
jgi:pilus assembly protein CpaE